MRRDNKRCDDHHEKADELDFSHIATKDFSSLGKRRTERKRIDLAECFSAAPV
jgi:hypothetical protein